METETETEIYEIVLMVVIIYGIVLTEIIIYGIVLMD